MIGRLTRLQSGNLRLSLVEIGIDGLPQRVDIGALFGNLETIFAIENFLGGGEFRVDLANAFAIGLIASQQLSALGTQLHNLRLELRQRHVLDLAGLLGESLRRLIEHLLKGDRLLLVIREVGLVLVELQLQSIEAVD